MKPVFQTKFGVPDGNCFAACLATLLECPLESIPFPPYEGAWLSQVNWWLGNTYGLVYAEVPLEAPWSWSGTFYCLATGKSPRGYHHAIVVQHRIDNNKHCYDYVHDPHPDGGWLVEMEFAGVLLPKWERPIQTLTPPVGGGDPRDNPPPGYRYKCMVTPYRKAASACIWYDGMGDDVDVRGCLLMPKSPDKDGTCWCFVPTDGKTE